MRLESFRGLEAKNLLASLASLRIEVFREFPYLYEGSFDYERKYLDRYFSSQNSLVIALWDKDLLVGASTAMYLPDEDPMISKAVSKFYDPQNFVYFGESLILRDYRGLGYGKKFFELRENFARSLNAKWVGFCAVIRDISDPRKPAAYLSPEFLWTKIGYEKIPNMLTQISWKEIGELKETPKNLQFWTKKL